MGIKCPKCQHENPDTQSFCGDCGTKLIPINGSEVTVTLETSKEELVRGSIFANRYEIIEELGKGGMGRVYRVEDRKTKEELALKLLKAEISADKKTLERFSNELRLAHKISHRNVCRMFHLGEDKGIHYITMEYVAGEDLKSFIRRSGKLDIPKAISVAREVCEGLSEAHRLGVVHRDLKSNNIMIDKEGNAQIMDFGIARSLSSKGITGEGIIIGTPDYMSPEQAEAREIDHRSDIYSLGVILYEMVTGELPFRGDSPLSIAMKHKGEIAKDPKDLNPQIRKDLNALILKCLEKDKENRYQLADELYAELNSLEKRLPSTQKIVPKRKPLASKEITVTFGLKKLLIPAFLVIAIVVVAVIVWRLIPQKEVAPISVGKPSIAIMYFKNDTGDEGLSHWRSALSQWLITDISQSRFIDVLPMDRLFSILRKSNLLEAQSYATEDLKKVAAEGGVNHIFLASLSKAGDTFRIDYSLQAAQTLEVIALDYVTGIGEGSFPSLVDEMTRKVKENLKFSAEEIASDIDKEVGKITTSSPVAYKYYSEGREYLNKGEFQKSIELMEKAIEADPNFALAYRSLWAASLKDDYLQKAFEKRSHLSDKERLWVEGCYYRLLEKTYDKAIEAFRKLAELDPESRVGYTNLGMVYNYIEEWDKAIENFEIPIQNKEKAFWPYHYQAISYMAKGLYDKAKDILEYYLNNFSDHVLVRLTLAQNYLCQGKWDLALVEVDRAFSLDPTRINNFLLKGDIYLCQGDLVKAENEYEKLLDLKDQRGPYAYRNKLGLMYILRGKFKEAKDQSEGMHSILAYIYLKSGDPEKALEECNKEWSSAVESENLSGQRKILHYKGIVLLEMNSMDKAKRIANELKEMIDKGMNKKHIRYYYHLLGSIELTKGNIPEAIKYFRETLSNMPFQYTIEINSSAIFLDSLAYAYYKAKDLGKAQEGYERITSLTVDRIFYGDIYARSFYMLGKIYEEQGDTAKAIENYEKFLELWKDADPGFAEVEDARKRLAGLKDQ